jgi:protein SCO1/2
MKLGKNLLSLTLGLFIFAFADGACQTRYTFHGTLVDPPEAAPGFTLTDDLGQLFQLDSLKGKVVLLYFGYTHCPDVCPLTLANLAQVRHALGPEASQVQVVFVTTDPGRDTAQVLKEYLGKFDGTFIGARGEWPEISKVLQEYYALASKRDAASSAPGYTVDHTAYIYAIDRKQQWRAIYAQDSKVEDIAGDVRYLLHEG